MRARVHERPQQPLAQQPGAHRRGRAIERLEQRAGASALGALDDVQMAHGHGIDQQRVGGNPQGDVPHVREFPALRVAQVQHDRAGRGNGGGCAIQPVPGQRGRAELLAERRTSPDRLERPGVHSRDRAMRRRVEGARPWAHRWPRGSPAVAARRVQPPARPWRRARRTPRRRTRPSRRPETPVPTCPAWWPATAIAARNAGSRASRYDGIRERARRMHPRHFALDDALGLARILDLIADGDPVAFLHQPSDVRVGRVVGHAAHRNGAAGPVLGARGQRQLQHARGGERVLVEHFVEVAHPKKHDGVAVLPLDVEVLTHRWRGRRRRVWRWGSRHRRDFVKPREGAQTTGSITLPHGDSGARNRDARRKSRDCHRRRPRRGRGWAMPPARMAYDCPRNSTDLRPPAATGCRTSIRLPS